MLDGTKDAASDQLLCTDKNDTLVKMTLPSDNNTIVASKYQLYLPTEQQLIAEVEKVRKEWEEGNGSNQK